LNKKLAEEIKYRRKKKLGSYPYISVIFSIALALFVIGLFSILILQTNKLITMVRENIEVQVFLDKNISENDIIRVRNVLSNSPFVMRSDERQSIKFISKTEAAKIFIKETGEDFREFLDENPLRDTYVLNLHSSYQQPDSLVKIRKKLLAVPGIYEVEYMESLISSINRNISKLSAILLGVAFVLVLIVIILINNTIKLAMYSQRFLIRSMQLVGARPLFIQWPFLLRSILHGMLGGIIASVSLFLLQNYAGRKIEELGLLMSFNGLLVIFVSISVVGILIAFFSTLRAVRKYLNMSLDELY
jgi:cell division transport system permease protein